MISLNYNRSKQFFSQFICFLHAPYSFFKYSTCESGFPFFNVLLARMNSYIVYTVILVYFALTIFQLNPRTVQCMNSIELYPLFTLNVKKSYKPLNSFSYTQIYNVQYLFDSSISASFHKCFLQFPVTRSPSPA